MASQRRKKLTQVGRLMTLRRNVLPLGSAPTELSVIGLFANFRPEQIGIGGILQGDAQVATLNDEFAASATITTPRVRDQMIITGRVWNVMGVSPIFEAETCIGYTLMVRGT